MNNYNKYASQYIVVIFTGLGYYLKKEDGKSLVFRNYLKKKFQSCEISKLAKLSIAISKSGKFEILNDNYLENALVIIHPEKKPNDKLKKTLAQYKNENRQVIFALHNGTESKEIRNELTDIACAFAHYNHETKDEFVIWSSFVKMCLALEKRTGGEFENSFVGLVEGILDGENIRKFSTLKHGIMHTFLDLDIDYQGILQVDGAKAVEYLTSVVSKRDNKYYEKKLVFLQRSLREIIKLTKAGEENIVTLSTAWKDLGFNSKGSLIDDNVNIAKYIRFLGTLINKIDKGSNIGKIDIDEFLAFKSCNEKTSFKFHDWFANLDNSLDRMREESKQNE